MKSYDEILSIMQNEYTTLAGFSPNDASDIGIRLKVLAKEVLDILLDLSELEKQIFPQTATGAYLDMHSSEKGIDRKSATLSTGYLRFFRQTQAKYDIEIPKGIICSTKNDSNLQFITTENAVLKAGEVDVLVPAQSQKKGSMYNVAKNTICVMITPAYAISGVENNQAFSGGEDEESDDSLKKRLLSSFSNISNGTNCAFYYDMAMSREGISSAKILPRLRGRGTVDIVVDCKDNINTPQIIDDLRSRINDKKEINVDALVYSATKNYVEVAVQIAVNSENEHSIVIEECTSILDNYINSLGVAQPLYTANISKILLETDGVYNVKILKPANDTIPVQNSVLRAGKIEVELLGA